MRVDFSAARLTVVVAPVDMRAGFAKLATIAESLLQIPVTSSGHYVAFVSKHRKLCKVIWCDDSGSCLLTRRLNEGLFERFLVRVDESGSGLPLTATEFERFLDGDPVYEHLERLKF